MPSDLGYYRSPTIRDDNVVFVCDHDLWSVPASGGTARRLSANPGESLRPCLSPDGRSLAFINRDEGSPEVWVMPAEGGEPSRLTHLGALTHVAGWRPDGSAIIFATDERSPFMGYPFLFEVAPSGGPNRPLNVGPAQSIAFRPDGAGMVIGRNTGDPARWKRYRGGTAGNLWIDSTGKGNFRPLIELPGNMASPMWIGSRIYFLSDHEGVGNLYSCRTSGKDLRRHTDHEDFYIRFPQSDGRRIVYTAGADLHLYDAESGEYGKIEVRTPSARPQRNRRFVEASDYIEIYDLHPEGHSMAIVARGRPYSFPLWEQAVTQHGVPDGARYRLVRWLPDGDRLIGITDEGGEEELVVMMASGTRRRVKLDFDLGRAIDLAVCPQKPDRVAIENHRHEVVIVDIGKKKATVVERSSYSRSAGIAWSPDGRWLAYAIHESLRTSSIKLYDTESGEVQRVTRPDFRDVAPAFDPEGRYLYFISYREYDPVYDSHHFDLGFPRGARLLAVPLTADRTSPFEATPRPPAAPPTDPMGMPEMDKNGKPKKREVKVEVDFEGIEDRVVAFPVPEGNYGRIAATGSKVYFTSYPIQGALGMTPGQDGPLSNATLKSWDMSEQKCETVVDGVTSFRLSGDGKALAYRAGNRLRALPAFGKPDPSAAGKSPGRESGWIDLSRVRVSVTPAMEWKQMYGEAWRLMRDHFWTPDMSGVDWQAIHERYLPVLERVATRSEFSDLMWEMQGELGTSHAYELGGDYRPEPAWQQGFLGADLDYDADAKTWRVSAIPRGDSWNDRASSPLAAPGVNVKPGDRLLSIDGTKLNVDSTPGQALVNLAGTHVSIGVARGDGKKKRTVIVKTLPSEKALRYRDWVETNRARVHAESGDRVGYVHIPNMGPHGYAEFHRYFLAELDRDGLIVDVRFNGGGHVSSLLLEKLLRRRIGYDTQRWGEPFPYPSEAPMGPMVALTNERAGSDGDIFSHCFKIYKLGPLIGKRTWGGVIGIWPRHALVDGTVTTQPEFSFWFEDVGFGVENYGTDPDIEVEIRPQDHAAGKDPQLARGISEIKALMKRRKSSVPDFSDRPKLGMPRLPKRG
jgi:tricorn protease